MPYVNGTTPLEIPLDTWKITSSSWGIGNGPLIVNGNVAAGAFTVPVTGLEISSNTIAFGNFSLTDIKIAGDKKLVFDSSQTTVSFGYDKGAQYGTIFSPQYGCWSLSMLPTDPSGVLTKVTNLPDMDANDGIAIMNVTLYSKGSESRIVLSQTQPPVKLNGFASFTPYSLENADGSLKIKGLLNLNIPALSGTENIVYNLNYAAGPSGSLIHIQDNIGGLKLVTNGIRANFDTAGQIFTGDSLVLNGTLMDKETNSPYSFPIHFVANSNGGNINVVSNVNNVIAMGSGKQLANITGSMALNGSTWDNFKFAGEIQGAKGLTAGSKVAFEVKGDLVVSKQAIGVANMPLGSSDSSGTFSLTYDFEKGAIVGSLTLKNVETPTATFDVGIEMQIGGSGWYFLGSANISKLNCIPFPLNGAGAAFCAGDADMSPGMLEIIQPVFHDGVIPDSFSIRFKHVSGTIFVAGIDVKLPLPEFHIDVDIAHVDITYGIYANAYAGLNFVEGAPEIAAGLKVGAYINVSAGASVGLVCAGVSAGADFNVSGEILLELPTISTLSPATFFTAKGVEITAGIKATLSLSGDAFVGGGVCNSNCESVKAFGVTIPPGCFKKEIGGGLSFDCGLNITKSKLSITPDHMTLFADLFGFHPTKEIDLPGL